MTTHEQESVSSAHRGSAAGAHARPPRLPATHRRRIEADFLRWPEFDKTARVASHSAHGVIELMPVADAGSYSFKYVNGHPAQSPRWACRP